MDAYHNFDSPELENLEFVTEQVRRVFWFAAMLSEVVKVNNRAKIMNIEHGTHLYPPYVKGLYSDSAKAKEIKDYHETPAQYSYSYVKAFTQFLKYKCIEGMHKTPKISFNSDLPDNLNKIINDLNHQFKDITGEYDWNHPFSHEWFEYTKYHTEKKQ
jgi:hypothetical protein